MKPNKKRNILQLYGYFEIRVIYRRYIQKNDVYIMALTIQKDQMHHALKIRILCLTFVLMYELVFAPINPIYNF